MVADATVNFMKFLVQHGMNVEQSSIAGFGVGAHIAGFIGAAFPKKKLAAIYGKISKATQFCFQSSYMFELINNIFTNYFF